MKLTRTGLARIALALALPLALAACTGGEMGAVDEERLLVAEDDPDNWLAHGRTYAEQRFSPLADINVDNVGQLALAYAVEFDTNRGQEATPIVVDGTMYLSTAWSKVMALDAATGEVLWRYDPQVDGAKGAHACCDVVNRGVAVWEGKVFVGTIDGRLVALDAATGEELWDVVTVDQSQPYTITGAPRVVRGKVIIGNSGAEMGVRGYVSAYDADSGDMVWRFYTVPGNPADGPDGAASDAAFARVRHRHMVTATGGNWAAAARCGIRSSMMPNSTSCWWASATDRRGTTACVRMARATTCS
jgi:quinohemoprotein ethanol dehydrogenase